MDLRLIHILTCTSWLPSSLVRVAGPAHPAAAVVTALKAAVVQPRVLGSLSLSPRTSCFLLELYLPLLGSLCTYHSLPQTPLHADTGVQIFSWTP